METSKAEAVRNEKVVNCLYQKPDALFRLVCFPWAGGGSIYFASWGQDFPNLVEVNSIRLAGRETRSQEPFPKDMLQTVDEIICALLPILQDKPFAFFGHSLGSLLAFLTASQLKAKYNLEPVHLFVSSTTPLLLKKYGKIIEERKLSEEEICQHIQDLGGTPQNIVEDKELLRQHIPQIKGDIQMVYNSNFDYLTKAILSCDITCFAGTEDIVDNVTDWKDLTSGSFRSHVLPGNHFYLMEPANKTFIKN
ncbi:S-acyl fatty acid synthase thioesterase, medium chain, partial [Galemys pyrenaicus]